ncbi:MAG: sodium/proline symporter PutP [Eubacteriales bacterium]
MNFELIAFIVYFAAVIGIGVFFFFREKGGGEKEYFLGGRSMGPWVTAMSAQASDMSAWLLMGLPGSILAFGLGQAWIGIGLALGTALNWIFVARRLRRFSQAAGDSITIPQYLSNRFATKHIALRVICAAVFLVCFTVYVASGFVAGTSVFTAIFDIDYDVAMIIFAVIIIGYTFLGGFRAVCLTDFFQGILMLIAVLSIPIMVVATQELDISALGNVYTYTDGGQTVTCSFTSNILAASPKEIINGLAWGLGYFGMPHILVRFMSIKKPSMIKKSAIVAIVWVILSLGAVIAIAYLGRMLVADELLPEGMQKMVFITLARKLFPSFIAGILLSAIIAASMSTADSQLLVASSSFTSDIYKPVIRKNASDKEMLWVGRGVVLVIAVIAYFIASSKAQGAQSIMNMVENAWAGFGSAFGPVIILSLFWRRFTYKGAVAGVVAGALTDVLWLAFLYDLTGVYELIPGFVVGMIAAVVVTLLDKAPSKDVTDIFDAATAKDAGDDEQ